MFQFTTTHVINSNQDFTSGKALWSLQDDTLYVKGVNNFNKDNVVAIYKAEGSNPELAQLKVDLGQVADVEKGDTLRLSIYVRLTTSDDCSYYANDNSQYKGRPFTVEFPWLGTPEKTAKNLEKIIKKYGLMVFEKELLKVSCEGTEITIESVNEFQRFHTYKLEKFVDSEKPFAELWKEIDGVISVEKEGKEGFGTYSYILRNIKLPTHENTRAFAVKANEMPVPGALYNQYTIHYCANRGPLGLNAVGHEVKSSTTHVFSVNQALLEGATSEENFEVALEGIGTVEPIGNKAQVEDPGAGE